MGFLISVGRDSCREKNSEYTEVQRTLVYEALDIFVCGACEAKKALPVLQKFFEPQKMQISEHQRG
jgi:S-adenosylmethionine/arginine decarboxylase-like enzyme